MLFGLHCAPYTIQQMMDKILTGMQGVDLFVYMDDLVVFADSLRTHTIKMQKLLGTLKTARLTLQTYKCKLLKREVTYLGHEISEEGVRPDSDKVKPVEKFPRPRTPKNVKQFVGLASYYRRFIPGFANIAKPLNKLLKNHEPFVWGEEQEQAFVKLKQLLCEKPILQYPNFNERFLVTCDASNVALGAVLSQGKVGQDLPVAYYSRTLTNSELVYSTTDKELLAVVEAVTHFRPYLYGTKFTIITDHKSLIYLHNLNETSPRVARWKLKLREYDYEIQFKPGASNLNADSLSRNPVLNINFIENTIGSQNFNCTETELEDSIYSCFMTSIRNPVEKCSNENLNSCSKIVNVTKKGLATPYSNIYCKFYGSDGDQLVLAQIHTLLNLIRLRSIVKVPTSNKIFPLECRREANSSRGTRKDLI